jgi:hypothetical protein
MRLKSPKIWTSKDRVIVGSPLPHTYMVEELWLWAKDMGLK